MATIKNFFVLSTQVFVFLKLFQTIFFVTFSSIGSLLFFRIMITYIMPIKIITLILFTSLYCTTVSALELMVGANISTKDIRITDQNENLIADMTSDSIVYPSLSLRSKSKFFNNTSSLSYNYELDFSIFNVNKQRLNSSKNSQDIGTSIKGYSLYAVPTLFYNFNKRDKIGWKYKAGLGIGIGYLNISGRFQGTNSAQPSFNQIKDVRTSGYDIVVGVNFQAKYNQHVITIKNFTPSIKNDNLQYFQSNVLLGYQYIFDIKYKL